ncbi:cupin domain-containing protein [Antrihabitans cavernicola]|uniref:Cupin domain-containing protein n=1 Tax=Antrihabitans cavernicola TaxID=2495913 RepID=A0A5A7SEL0_9NOCA|nr:cupin domain-containing protein [Spelaeibacter cavernicola]KAA0023582.1 cupin domain-containing protein [Spelaeibacter cavernicola]
MTTDISAPAAIVLPEEAEVLGDDSSSIRLLTDASATGGAVSSLEVRMAAGVDGASPHFHTRSSELFYVIDGELQVLADDKIMTVGAGGSLVVPKRMIHAFGAAPGAPARVLIALTPGVERFDYFRLLGRIRDGEATADDLMASQDRFDNHFVGAPNWWAEREAGRR